MNDEKHNNDQEYRQLLERVVQQGVESNMTLKGILKAIEEISETNKLINQSLVKNTVALDNIEKFWGRIVMILVMALVVLAGAEEVLKFFIK